MNLLLLQPGDIVGQNEASISARITEPGKIRHITRILKLAPGDTLRTGMLDDRIGTATITAIGKQAIELEFTPDSLPPAPRTASLLVAMPRPPVFRRLLVNLASAGIKHVVFFQSERVEKSYWQSPSLNEENIHRLLVEGLEQGMDTALPRIDFCKQFHRLSDCFPEDIDKTDRIVLHPGNGSTGNTDDDIQQKLLCIGPEGGFREHEVLWLEEHGFRRESLGHHILKVEAAVFTALGALVPANS